MMDQYHMVNSSRTVRSEQVVVCLLTVAQKKPMFADSLTALVKVTMLLLMLGGWVGGGLGSG